jgi:hypothetical protein
MTACSLDDDKDMLMSPPEPIEDKHDDHHAPSWDDYVVDTLLGEGAYGKVFKVYKKSDQAAQQMSKQKHPLDFFHSLDNRST